MKFDAVHINSAPEVLVQEIVKQIETGGLMPGECLPSQRDLAKMFRVGLGSVREAIKVLNVMGYVEVIRGKGTYISKYADQVEHFASNLDKVLDAVSLAELIRAREIIECGAARLAAEVADHDAVERLLELRRKMDEPDNDTFLFYKLDFEFHMAVAEATHNKAIIEIAKILVDRSHEYVGFMDGSLKISKPLNQKSAVASAKEVIDAISRGSGIEAEHHMRVHIHIVDDNIKNAFPSVRLTDLAD